MIETAETREQFHRCLDAGRLETEPYRHWLLRDMFPEVVSSAVTALPVGPAEIGDTEGKRETHNSARTFFSPENRQRHGVCRTIADALQAPATIRKLEETCGIDLKGAFLRIEYCQDTDGFWLEPHTDITVKLFTMLLYLSTEPESEGWGTDIYDADGNRLATAPYRFNAGLIFIPADDTWHGFHPRPINGVRKSLIVNYVTDEWRARHELCYPEQPAL
jgi:hypothetical protein